MIAIAVLAGMFAFILCCGILSFLMMFQDHTPSQNSYAWPYLIPIGAIGLLVMGVAALSRWLM